MKKLDFGQTVQILANIGVIAGIVFLGFEIQQNNAALNLQARLDWEDTIRQGIRARLNNPEIIRATSKAIREEQLSVDEEILLNDANRAALIDFWFAYRQAQDGVLSVESLPVDRWRVVYHERPLMDESWINFQPMVAQDSEFIQWFDRYIVAAE